MTIEQLKDIRTAVGVIISEISRISSEIDNILDVVEELEEEV